MLGAEPIQWSNLFSFSHESWLTLTASRIPRLITIVLTGIGLASLYWLIYPGNIAQYAEKQNMPGLDNDRARLIRLFGQPALIAAALWRAGIPKK